MKKIRYKKSIERKRFRNQNFFCNVQYIVRCGELGGNLIPIGVFSGS
jgi:hypothetical protein